MKILGLVLLVSLPHFSFAKELLKFETQIQFTVCDKAGNCEVKSGATETFQVELGDKTVLSRTTRSETDGFAAIVSIDVSRNYVKPYGVRFRYDSCTKIEADKWYCIVDKEMMGYLLMDSLKGLSGGEMLFTGLKHSAGELEIRPTIKLKNIEISPLR